MVSGKFNEDQNRYVNEFLSENDINLKWIGRQYIRDIAEMLFFDSSLFRSLNNYVYPKIAERYKTKPSNVEKSIRNAINKSIYHEKNKYATNKMLLIEVVEKLKTFSSNDIFVGWLWIFKNI